MHTDSGTNMDLWTFTELYNFTFLQFSPKPSLTIVSYLLLTCSACTESFNLYLGSLRIMFWAMKPWLSSWVVDLLNPPWASLFGSWTLFRSWVGFFGFLQVLDARTQDCYNEAMNPGMFIHSHSDHLSGLVSKGGKAVIWLANNLLWRFTWRLWLKWRQFFRWSLWGSRKVHAIGKNQLRGAIEIARR